MSTQVKKGSKDSFGSGTESQEWFKNQVDAVLEQSKNHSQIRLDKCGICSDTIKQARMLSCLHSFCEHCLFDKITRFPATVKCAECGEKTEITNASDFPIDYTKAINSSRSLRLVII